MFWQKLLPTSRLKVLTRRDLFPPFLFDNFKYLEVNDTLKQTIILSIKYATFYCQIIDYRMIRVVIPNMGKE
jgi:hypothetical protein